jgi:hypothetical protein
MVEILGKEIANEMNELTIQQFEEITDIHANEKLDIIEKHLEVFKYMGVSNDIEEVDFEVFKEYVEKFNTAKVPSSELLKRFEKDGYTYQAYDDDFKLTAKDTKLIEKILGNKHKGYISEVLAVLFKRTDLTKTEHYTDAHIKHKAKLIRELKADVAVPYLVAVANKINNHVQKSNEETEGLA